MAAHITNDFRLPSCPVTSAARATHELMKAVSCNSLAPGPGRLPGPTRSTTTSRVARLARHRRTRTRTACTRLRAGRRRTTHACTSRSPTHTTMHIIPPTATAARTLQPTTAATRQLRASVLDRLELGETPRRVELACQELGRSRWAAASLQVTNYEFERVAHTELHTPGLLATRCKKLPRLERHALGSRSRAGVTTSMRWRIHSNANASMAPEAEVGSSCRRGDARSRRKKRVTQLFGRNLKVREKGQQKRGC